MKSLFILLAVAGFGTAVYADESNKTSQRCPDYSEYEFIEYREGPFPEGTIPYEEYWDCEQNGLLGGD